MRSKNKALLLVLCVVMLVSATAFGTLAYLTDNDQVTNTFTVGNIEIILDEAPVDTNGDATTGPRVKTNSYKLLPGHEYDKDPTVHVQAGSENCYLFVTVKNEISAIEAETTVAKQMENKGWKEVTDATGVAADEKLYVYATGTDAKTSVAANTDVVVFENFKIDGAKVVNVPDGETVPAGKFDLAAYTGKTIVVTAYAVQVDGFDGETPANIWNTVFANA